MAKTRLAGRSAVTGKFITIAKARKDKKHAVVEGIKNPKKKKIGSRIPSTPNPKPLQRAFFVLGFVVKIFQAELESLSWKDGTYG